MFGRNLDFRDPDTCPVISTKRELTKPIPDPFRPKSSFFNGFPLSPLLPTASALNAAGIKRGNRPEQKYPRWRKRFRAGLKPFRA